MIKTVVIFSKSLIKTEAVASALKKYKFVCKDYVLETVEPGETNCPQPIGHASAWQCVQRRISPFRDAINATDANTLFIAVENYLDHQNAGYVDRVLVALFTNRGNWHRQSRASDSLSVRVPDAYVPNIFQNEQYLDGIVGCKTTLGQLMHTDNPQCPSDDWFKFSPYFDGTTRHIQILNALMTQLTKLDKSIQAKKALDAYENFPIAQVTFFDVFPLITQPSVNLAAKMVDAIDSCWLGDYFVVGLESRGLILASMISTCDEKPFVPCRKKGKLPRNDEYPVATQSYATEYSHDTLEIQPRHITKEMRNAKCVLVDDVLATGGSVCAAADLLKQLDIQVAMVLVLFDVPALKDVWKKTLSQSKNLANVPVRFVL